jgi:hypothetical protein
LTSAAGPCDLENLKSETRIKKIKMSTGNALLAVVLVYLTLRILRELAR